MSQDEEKTKNLRGRRLGVIVGIIAFVGVLLSPDLDPGNPHVSRAAAVALLMAIWWISEAVPLAITSLLPIVLLPLLGVMDGKLVSAQYINHIIFLFMGGFLIALAMEKCQLHKRIALGILMFTGKHPARLLLGFMLATAFLSMWISNTATAMMMLPIALAIITRIEKEFSENKARRFAIALLLGIAYSASIGGIATLVGTPPNLSFSRIFAITFPDAPSITFAKWFIFALPISIAMFITTWLYLSFFYMPSKKDIQIDQAIIKEQYAEMGAVSRSEKIVLIDFLLVVFLWLFRKDIPFGDYVLLGWSNLFPNPEFINDGTVAIAMALVLFLIPDNEKGERILDWPTATRIPWHIVLLFGGGFALAKAFDVSGLAAWIGNELSFAGKLGPLALLFILCGSIIFLTELTSNTATAEMILPILAALGVSINVNPLFLMLPVTLSCSFAFMMPVATPPNAIVFGSERIRMIDMIKAGFWLNLIGLVIIVLMMLTWGTHIWELDMTQLPNWAK